MRLIHCRWLGRRFWQQVLKMPVSPKNHRQEAAATPLIKSEAVSAGSDERKAPSISVPSITACGLNQVTVKASVAVCHSVGWL